MTDAHVHLDKGELSLQYVNKFIQIALEMGIDEIYFLQHTNMFTEFMPIYGNMRQYNDYQRNWVNNKVQNAIPLSVYTDFIDEMRKVTFPVKVKMGLEVCYEPQYEGIISDLTKRYKFDFLVGSVHSIDGWAFSHLKQKWTCDDVDVNLIYRKYYDIMIQLVKSRLFNGLAHPDSLSCFNVFPSFDLTDIYVKLAQELNSSDMYVELSSGLAVNYGIERIGMDKNMLSVMKSQNVKIKTASDAHKPENLGRYIKEMQHLITAK